MKICFSKSNITRENCVRIISLLFLFLAGMNFQNRYCYLTLFAVGIFILFKRKIIVDINTCFLLMLAISWIVFSPDTSQMAISLIVEPCLYPLAYLLGRNFFGKNNYNIQPYKEELLVRKVIIIISIAPYIHFLLNYFKNIDYKGRNSIDFWTNTVLSATNQAVMGIMILAVAIALLVATNKIALRIISIVIITSILAYNLMLSGRTLIVMLVVVATVCSVYMYRDASNSKKRVKIAIGIFFFIAIVYILFEVNFLGIQNHLVDSNLYYRFMYASNEEVLSSGRLERKIKHLHNFDLAFWGGQKIHDLGIGYAHDIYLDTYDEAGIIALVMLLLFTISAASEIMSFLKMKKLQFTTRVLVLAVYLVIFMQFMVEPILQGVQWLFMLFCFIHGLVVHLRHRRKLIN